ncbi:MAG: sugar ABC transporter permease [Actinobacteria bacterium]|nr:sugar ABC transporter permease [Actinomycetota bacterium]
MSAGAAAFSVEPEPQSYAERLRTNVRTGNLGSTPVLVALGLVVLYFGLTADNFFTPLNFSNLIGQMTGTCLLAYGVVFVLLIGEIDLSIGFVSGVGGMIAALLQQPDPLGPGLPGWLCIVIALACTTAIGLFQGSIVALILVPSFVVTLAGLLIWQGLIQLELPGVVTIQDNTINNVYGYFFSDTGGWIIGVAVSAVYVALTLGGVLAGRRHGIAIRDPALLAGRLIAIPAITLLTVSICNKDRGVPFALLLVVVMLLVLTFLAKRTTFGRHVYAVGGNAEAARRAGINVARIRILVFMISGFMAGLGGVVLASRLQSVDLNAGGSTLLIDAIAAAVIGGTSLFGGRGEIRNALIGAALIATIANGMNTKGWENAIIYVVTGGILLLAVTFDTIVRRIQIKAGR